MMPNSMDPSRQGTFFFSSFRAQSSNYRIQFVCRNRPAQIKIRQ